MMDFVKLGDKDPYIFVLKDGSYFHFKQHVDKGETSLTALHEKLLKFLGTEICNGKRLEEVVILKLLLKESVVDSETVIEVLKKKYKLTTNVENIKGALNVLSMNFFKDADAKKYGNIVLAFAENNKISLGEEFANCLNNPEFKMYVADNIDYSIYKFMSTYDEKKFFYGLKLYENYSRKDVVRILNWEKDESSTVYGYRVKYDTCPMFVTYKKDEDVSASTKYEDYFVSPSVFNWMSRNKVTVDSPEIISIRKKEVVKLLFVKKSDGEGTDFYFMGEVDTKDCIQTTIDNDKGEKLSIVNVVYDMKVPVNEKIYSYFEG